MCRLTICYARLRQLLKSLFVNISRPISEFMMNYIQGIFLFKMKLSFGFKFKRLPNVKDEFDSL